MLVLIVKVGKHVWEKGIVCDSSAFYGSDLLNTVKCPFPLNLDDKNNSIDVEQGDESSYLLTQEKIDCVSDVVHITQLCSCINDLLKEQRKSGSLNIYMNSYLFSCFINEVKHSEVFRKSVIRNFLLHNEVRNLRSPITCQKSIGKINQPNDSYHLQVIVHLSWPQNLEIDFAWSDRAVKMINEKLELENLMAWLSTLGGAYSALGDEFIHCAEVAGKISLKQVRIALKLADPITVSKCKVYFAISLLQQGYFKEPVNIIREQYRYGNSLHENVRDTRLIKMCKGVWAKIQYIHSLNRQRRGVSKCSISNHSIDS